MGKNLIHRWERARALLSKVWRRLIGRRSDDSLLPWLTPAVDTMQLGVTICDLEGRILFTNPAEARMHGYTVAELVGQDVRIFAPPNPAPRRSGPELQRASRWMREGWNVRKDGSRFPVRLLSDVLRDADGEPIGLVTTCEDISERKQAEETLRRSEARYRAIVEHAAHGICRIGPEERFTAVNPALVRMLEYDSADELLGLDLREAVYQTPAQAAEFRHAVASDDRLTSLELEWRRKDGSPITVRVGGRALRDRHGRLVGYELIVEDVTEHHALEAQLRQAQKMEVVGQLTSGIAHDFNNVLGVIVANIDLVAARRPRSWAQMREEIEEVQDAARRGSAMIRQLMAFSRHEQLRFEPVDLGALLREQVGVLSRILPETIDVRVAGEDGLPPARADARAVEQILLNLATNARDAMPQGGTLQLMTSRTWLDADFRAAQGWGEPGEYVALFVGDTGAGMDAATRARIFEPFFTTKPTGQGTGLGMAMVYGLMKQHRGFVHVYSEAGEGTTIKLWFPVVTPDDATGAPEPRLEALPRGSETLLVVEDEAPLRRAARRVLEQYGYTVLVAADGEEGWTLFQEQVNGIDLIITDLVMPRLGGRDLADRIATSGHRAPVLFATGYSAQDVQATRAVDPGVPLLHKPWTMADLLLRVRQVLDATDPHT